MLDPDNPAPVPQLAHVTETHLAKALPTMQRAVVRLLSLGCSVAESARILGISERTADNHKSRAMSRLRIHKVTALTRFVIESGISPPEDTLTSDERNLLENGDELP